MRQLLLLALLAGCATGGGTPDSPLDARDDGTADDAGEVPDEAGGDDDAGDDADAADGADADDATDVPVGPVTIELRNDGFYGDGVRFLPLVLWGRPIALTDEEALAAGFDILAGPGAAGHRLVPIERTGAALAGWIDPYLDDDNIVGWLGPDEPLWNGMTIDQLRADYVTPLRAVDPDRPFVVNHAPRGTTAEPTNFDLLLPWLADTQAVAMDIYPVPEGNGHSAMADHPGLDAVGAHADVLRDLVEGSGRMQPFLMVLLGAGLGRIPTESWQILENWAEAPGIATADVRGVVTCDIDGDAADEVVAAGVSGGRGVLRAYDFGTSPFGVAAPDVAVPADLEMSGLHSLLCADVDGDDRQDLVLLVDGGATRQDFWLSLAGRVGLGVPALRYRAAMPDIEMSVIHHAVAGDFDADGCGDLAVTYDYPDGRQAFFVLRSTCGGFPAGTTFPIETWYETDAGILDLEAWPLAVAGDFDADGDDDLALGRTSGGRSVLQVLRSTGSGFVLPATAFDQPTSVLDLTGARLAAGDFDGAPGVDLAVAQGTVLQVLPPTLPAPAFGMPATWYAAGGFDAAALLGMDAGDIDGDGRADLALVDVGPSGWPRLRLGASTGRSFGARDPMPQELRFMWLDAVAHGAAGIVSWGQQFAAATDVAWTRLAAAAAEFHELQSSLAGVTSDRTTAMGRTTWWVSSVYDLLHLVEINETRFRDVTGASRPLPPGKTGSSVVVWNSATRAFEVSTEAHLTGGTIVDARPMEPYEVRVYRVMP